MSSFGRFDVIVLALMLVYLLRVFIHVCWQCYEARRTRKMDSANRKTLVASLKIHVGNLSSIALTAPYFGLAGTCIGILHALSGDTMQRDAFRAAVSTAMAVALVPTATAIPVAVLAASSHKYLRRLIDLLEDGPSNDRQIRQQPIRTARGIPSRTIFAGLPAFALLAAPILAIVITGYMTFSSFHTPTGFYANLGEANCESDLRNSPIVLHITDSGKLFLNSEEVEWKGLANRLSMIYSMRANREIYVLADSTVLFRTVAEALDTVEDAPSMVETQSMGVRKERLNIKLTLVTPRAMNAGCQPVRARVF